MKKSLIIIFALAIGVWTTGCDSNNRTPVAGTTAIAMEMGTEYQVNTSDWVESDGAEAAQVSVRHVYDGDRKYVTLVSGSALLHQDSLKKPAK